MQHDDPKRGDGRSSAVLDSATDPTELPRPVFEDTFADLYQEARQLARRTLRGGMAPWHRESTMNTTALVNEAYLKLHQGSSVRWDDKQHFLALVARAMRFAFVDYARAHTRAKRGDGQPSVPLEDVALMSDAMSDEVLQLDLALERLALRSKRLARVVECRFVVGFSIEETATALDVSSMTVKRDWITAKAFLARELRGGVDAAVLDHP